MFSDLKLKVHLKFNLFSYLIILEIEGRAIEGLKWSFFFVVKISKILKTGLSKNKKARLQLLRNILIYSKTYFFANLDYCIKKSTIPQFSSIFSKAQKLAPISYNVTSYLSNIWHSFIGSFPLKYKLFHFSSNSTKKKSFRRM